MDTERKGPGKLKGAEGFKITPPSLVVTERLAEPSDYTTLLELGIEMELEDPSIRVDVVMDETGKYDFDIKPHVPKSNRT